ncbi:unnamed protein product [Polarella glacialis]|uniref:Uncharacterized protein n=2 Tax=Polarella glacialis TaxID=89957 RepID=A0A813LAW0_POLGL|nr:unnamed protein product [Polarella glacialis]CAE8727366.1 unnamed protein product [Polarella glacialis]
MPVALRTQGGWHRLANNWEVVSASNLVDVLSPAPATLEFIIAPYTLLPVPAGADIKQVEVVLSISEDGSDAGFVERRIRALALLRPQQTTVFSALLSGQKYQWNLSLACPDLASVSPLLVESGCSKTAWVDGYGCINDLALPIAEVAHPERAVTFGMGVRLAPIRVCPEQPQPPTDPKVQEKDGVRIVQVEAGVWFGYDPELAEVVSNAVDNTFLKTEENISQALRWCGLDRHAAGLLEEHSCFGIQSPVLWTTHARWLRGVQDNEEYSRHVHIDGDCLGVDCKNAVPSGKCARNVWVLLDEALTQPVLLVLESGECVYNPGMVRGSFLVFDYAVVPHTALPHLQLPQNTHGKRQSIDYRFLGDQIGQT